MSSPMSGKTCLMGALPWLIVSCHSSVEMSRAVYELQCVPEAWTKSRPEKRILHTNTVQKFSNK
eukprot:6081473-Amphidinium_carterae.1